MLSRSGIPGSSLGPCMPGTSRRYVPRSWVSRIPARPLRSWDRGSQAQTQLSKGFPLIWALTLRLVCRLHLSSVVNSAVLNESWELSELWLEQCVRSFRTCSEETPIPLRRGPFPYVSSFVFWRGSWGIFSLRSISLCWETSLLFIGLTRHHPN